MFHRIANGWELAKQSYRVIWLDKELLVFPLISGVCCLLVVASFALPLYAAGYAETVAEDAEAVAQQPLAYVVLFAFYFCNYFVITFFNSALVACAVIRFNGGDPTLADGFHAAISRLPQILSWALVAATVGVILKVIEDRSQRIGRFVAGLLGMAWSIGTYFVVPVLVMEKVSPFQAIQRSMGVLKQTWGEAIVANFGLGLLEFLFFLAALVPTAVGAYFGLPGVIAGGAVSLLLVILLALASSAVRAVLVAALYEYGTEGRAPKFFDEDLLCGAFAAK